MFTFKRVFILCAMAALTVSVIDPAMAKGGRGGGGYHGFHPRRAEVMHRDRNVGRRLSRDEGHLGGHYRQFRREDRGIAHQVHRDMHQNGGYLTRGEQRQVNREENGVNRQIASDYRGRGNWNRGPGGQGYRSGQGNWNRGQWNNNRSQFDKDHPRRAEVLGRDNQLGRDLYRDKGKLGGNYQSLKSQDQSIRQQERADAKANGGYITPQQKQQLNQEEKTLHKDIRQDLKQ